MTFLRKHLSSQLLYPKKKFFVKTRCLSLVWILKFCFNVLNIFMLTKLIGRGGRKEERRIGLNGCHETLPLRHSKVLFRICWLFFMTKRESWCSSDGWLRLPAKSWEWNAKVAWEWPHGCQNLADVYPSLVASLSLSLSFSISVSHWWIPPSHPRIVCAKNMSSYIRSPSHKQLPPPHQLIGGLPPPSSSPLTN